MRCIDYLENEFIHGLRSQDKRSTSTSTSSTKLRRVETEPSHSLRRSSTNILLEFDFKTTDHTKLSRNINKKNQSLISSQNRQKFERSKSSDSKSSDIVRKICCCLLDSKKNDFYQNQRSYSIKNDKKYLKQNVKKNDIVKDPAEDSLLKSTKQKNDKNVLGQKQIITRDSTKGSREQYRRLTSSDPVTRSQLINKKASQKLKRNSI